MPNTIKITMFGDICPVRSGNPFGFKLPEDEIIIGNLECVLTDRPKAIKKTGPILYAPEAFAAILKETGFDAVSLANNHIRDCGDEGIFSTLAVCDRNGIQTFGAGSTSEAAAEPLIIEKNRLKVGFLSFAEKEFNYVRQGRAGATPFDPDDSFRAISALRAKVDAVIVLYHGGIEHYIYPSPLLMKKCRKMVEAGADVVLCQHSHCIGTYEEYKGGKILYGQGNSAFGWRKGDDAWNHGLLARISVSDANVKVNYEVLETDRNGVVGLAVPSVSMRILSSMEKESAKIADESFIAKSWKEFCQRNAASYLAMTLGFGTNMNRLNRLLKNGLVRLLYNRRELNVVHNIIRCDSHREVIDTILKEWDF